MNDVWETVTTVEDESQEEPQPGPSSSSDKKGKRPVRKSRQPVKNSKRLHTNDREEDRDDQVDDEDEEEEDEEDEEITGEPEKLTRVKNAHRGWSARRSNHFGTSVPPFQKPDFVHFSHCNTPYDFFKLFMSDEFVDEVVTCSRWYCGRKDKPDMADKITNNSIRLTQAIMYISGYSVPSNRRMFWENREDAMNILVKKTMARNQFSELIRFTYFTQFVTPDPSDRFWKVRLLFDQLNKSAKLYVMHPEHVSVDEAIVKYFGPHPLKQFMRGKPHRFGYKVMLQDFFSFTYPYIFYVLGTKRFLNRRNIK